MSNKNQGSLSYKIGTALGVFIVIAIIIGAVALVIYLWWRFAHMTPHDWSVLGDITRNTAGLIALCSALLTIRVMHRTNMARAQEATSSEFRDQMQWAADGLSSNEPIKMVYAQMLLQRYAEEKPKLLSERDHQLAKEMWELTQALYADKPDEVLEEDPQKGNNEDK